MPFISDDDPSFRTNTGTLAPLPRTPPDIYEASAAAFRQSNVLVSTYQAIANSGSFTPDPDHNPLDVVRGTKFEAQHLRKFVASRSEAETRAIMGRIDGEERDQKTLDAAGAGGVLLSMLAGTLDPTIALPGSIAIRAGRGGYEFTRAALNVGAAGALQAGVQETILQATQETRTASESLLNVASATVLAGLIGGAASRLISPAERQVLEQSLDRARADMGAHANPDMAGARRGVWASKDTDYPVEILADAAQAGPDGRMYQKVIYGGSETFVPLDELRISEPSAPSGGATSAGAAATDIRTLEMPTSIPGTSRLSPTRFVLDSESIAARRIMADTAETPYSYKQSGEGVAASQGPPVSRQVQLETIRARVTGGDELDRLFKDYYFGADPPKLAQMRAGIDGFFGRPEGKMGFAEFKKAAGEAAMFGDQHEIPQVAAAAQFIRANVLEPWAARAEQSVEGFKRLTPAEGESYFPHLWNKQKITARKPEFTDKLVEKYRADQATKAGIKERLEYLNVQLQSAQQSMKRREGQIERLDVTRTKLAARFDEREMEVRRAEARAGTLEERATEIGEELSEVSEFIASMRQEARDPQLLARLDAMEREVAELRRADKPMTEAQLRQVEQEELSGILTGTTRMAAEMVAGRRAYPKAPSFLTWLVTNGGMKDTGGEVASMLGGARTRPGLLNRQRGMEIDRVAEKLQQDFPGAFPARDIPGGGVPEANEILGWIDEALRGRDPGFWIESMSSADRASIEAGRVAAALDEAFTRAGVKVKSARDVAKVLRDDTDAPMSLADLERVTAEMEAVGEAIPVSVRRAGVENELFVERQALADLRGVIAQARADKARQEQNLRVARGRAGEAAFAEGQNKGRLGLLDERMDRADRRRELLVDMAEISKRHHDDVRAKIEEQLGTWSGDSATEAKAALKVRADAEAERQAKIAAGTYKGAGDRMASADRAVDLAVKRIMASDRDLSDQELRAIASQTVDRILSSPDGRLPYDVFSNSNAPGGASGGAQPRGSLAARQLDVTNAWARDWIEDDIEEVMNAHLRTFVPDVILTERHGDTEMTQAFRAINDDYARLSDAARGNEKKQTKLEAERQAVISRVAGIRDRIRGTYGWSPDMQNLGRVTVALKQVNNLTNMGMASIASIADFAGAPIRHGIATAFADGWVPFFRAMTNPEVGAAMAKQRAQLRALGVGVDTALNLRQHAFDDIVDGYKPQSRVERALQWTNDKFFVANLLAPLTDVQKRIAGSVAINEALRGVKAITEGRATGAQIRDLADAGIDANMASRIHRQFFENGHGEVVDKVYVPNTGDWTDQGARMAFEGAVTRAVDIAVITPGQEKPLLMSKPVGSLLLQFKSFPAAATERILISNLQRRDAKALSGVITSVALGMLSYKINSLLGGQPVSDRPQDWVKEGISRSGLIGWLEEGNAMAAKLTRGTIDVHRLYGADKPLSRYASRSLADAFLGPTAGKLAGIGQVGGAAFSGEWGESDTRALRRLMFFQNMVWLRGALNQVEGGANSYFGVD